MPATTKPHFGKRQAVGSSSPKRAGTRRTDARPVSLTTSAAFADHDAFLAAVRVELAKPAPVESWVVPRSSRAALLAGLVVGCALVGFDVNGSDGAAKVAAAAGMFGLYINPTNLLPGLILLGLLGGSRASALTVVAAHELLRRAQQTSHAAYAAGGAAASLALAAAVSVFGHLPSHGWMIEALSGAGTGFFYRVFAGSRPA